jgi:hypothetical protein
MSASATLPSSLNLQLTAVIRRLRFMRLMRGLSRTVIGMMLFLAAALLMDFAFDLPGEIRGVLLLGWLVIGCWLAIRGLILAMRHRLAAEVVAAAIEEQFPSLAERLTTTIELAPLEDEFHGSADLKALLMAETESLSSNLNFQEAFPARRTAWWSFGAAFTLLLVLSPTLFWPGRFAELSQRFFMPWNDAFRLPYALEVTPGDAFAANGRSLTLTAQLLARRQGATLPQACSLVRTDANGTSSRDRMISSSEGFSFKVPRVLVDFAYHIEAGKAISDTFQIVAVDPVEIETGAQFIWQGDSPAISIEPPVYARATIPTEMIHEIADLSALQHSQVDFFLRFNLPAVAARVILKIQEDTEEPRTGSTRQPIGSATSEKTVEMKLSVDRRDGRVALPASRDGTYQIILEAEHGILTELDPRKLSVRPDQPPKFAQVSGAEEAKEVNPYDLIPLEITLTDDVGVDSAEVEYRVNKGPSIFEPITLDGKGTQKATAKHRFSIAGKVKDGDEFTYRLKAKDNRRLPEFGLEPNVTYYPPETEPGKPRWRTLKVVQNAKPIGQQDIITRRDDINRRLEAIKEDLLKEQRGLYKLRMESRYQSNLMPDQVEDLRQSRRDVRDIEKAIRDLARTASESPNFVPLARRAQDVADRQMQNADQNLKQAEIQPEFRARDKELKDADRELATAIRRLEAMHHEADRLAQLRLDQMNLENLANRQEQLAQEATDQIMRDPVKQPAGPNDLRKLQQNQNELVNDLQKQIRESPDLRQALESIRAEQAKGLSDRARGLAQSQRDLNRAAAESEKQQNRDKLAELARKQQDLADRADRLAKETRQQAEATHTSPLKAEAARQAAKALQQGDATQAMRSQDQSAQELNRLSRDLDKAREQGRNHEAARQLAERQEMVRQKVAEVTQKNDPKQADHLKELEREQKAIQQAAEKLAVPQENAPAQVDRAQAVERATKAAEALQKADAAKADSRMTQARQALEHLGAGPDTSKMKLEPQAQESRRLAEEQRQLRNEVERQSRRTEPLTAQAKEQQKNLLNRQEELRHQAGDLAGELLPLGQQLPQVPQLMQAFSSEHNARGSMKQAKEQTQAGNLEQAQKSRQDAAQFLEQAAQQINQAAQQMARTQAADAGAQQQTGQALQQAQGQMKQAQGQLNQGQNRPAQNAMHQASQALQQAAQQLAQQQQNQPGAPVPDSTPNGRGVAQGGMPNIELFGKDKEKYAGKPWGQLPGELRNQIIQDMKARYGEDYARIIKLYFEQIAETKEEKK